MKSQKSFFVFLFLMLTCCQPNVLKEFSSRESSPALFEDAMKLTDAGDYDGAFLKLGIIEAKDVGYASTDRFKRAKAGIQAGQCGLTFISFVDGLTQATASGAKVFELMMQAFKGRAVVPQKCSDAQATMATLTSTNEDQLLFLAVLGMAKVGTYLRDRADRDGTGSNGDGGADVGFDSCDATAGSDKLTDADLKEVITGLGLSLQNFALIGGSFSSSGAAGSLTAMQAFCDDPAGDGTGGVLDADKINCQITDASSASLTPQLLRAFRRILKTYDTGLGVTAPGCNLNPIDPAYCCGGLATP